MDVIDPGQFEQPNVSDLNQAVPIADEESGRLVVLRWPKEEETGGGIQRPAAYQRHPECLAFVLLSTNPVIFRGDTIMAAEYIFQAHLTAIQEGVYVMNTRDAILHYPCSTNPMKAKLLELTHKETEDAPDAKH